ncbi:MAG: hypothetical protein QW193_00415 [Nitrososphaerales archaeon]
MRSEEELIKDSYKFYYSAVKELEGIKEKNAVPLLVDTGTSNTIIM